MSTSATPIGITGLALLAACLACDADSTRGDHRSRATSPPSPEAGVPAPWFEEVAVERGLLFVHRTGHDGRFLMPEIVSGGAALFDADSDGDLDAYLLQAGGVLIPEDRRPPNQLFRNNGRGFFEDMTSSSGTGHRGYGMGVACGDIDNDGDTDLYVTNLGANAMFSNSGDGRFGNVTQSSGTGDTRWGSSAAFFDADLDGTLDLFVVNYINWFVGAELDCRDMMGLPDYCSPLNYGAAPRHLFYLNTGGGVFVDASEESGIAQARGTGLGLACADFDDDGLVDVFVANDGMPDFLWHNLGDARFENTALRAGCALDHEGTAKAGMGVAVGDIDGDLDLDLMVCNRNRESDSFFENTDGRFRDRASAAGLRILSRPFTRFGMGWIDFNNDGRLDLYQSNGRVERQSVEYAADPLAEPNLVLTRDDNGRFREVLPRGGTRELLFGTGRAAVFGDVDGDGGVDVLVVNKDGPVHLLVNRVPNRGNWIGFQVLDRGGSVALGASVFVISGEQTLRRDVRSAYSYLAANEARVHFGLGLATSVEEVRVRWPDGEQRSFGPLPLGRTHRLVPSGSPAGR